MCKFSAGVIKLLVTPTPINKTILVEMKRSKFQHKHTETRKCVWFCCVNCGIVIKMINADNKNFKNRQLIFDSTITRQQQNNEAYLNQALIIVTSRNGGFQDFKCYLYLLHFVRNSLWSQFFNLVITLDRNACGGAILQKIHQNTNQALMQAQKNTLKYQTLTIFLFTKYCSN